MYDDGALHRAAADLSHIRRQLSRSVTFRGYRMLTVGISGVIGIATALLQPHWAPTPETQPRHYIALWCSAALVCLAAAGTDMLVDVKRTKSSLTVALTLQAIGYFIPTLVLGAGVTLVLLLQGNSGEASATWILPGIWSLLFALGCFASNPVLPRVGQLSGIWYGIGGILCIALRERALDPLCMGIIFGVGQLLTTVWLYVFQERHRDPQI